MSYYVYEIRNPDRDADAHGRGGVVHGQRRQTIASARNGHSRPGLAGPAEELRNAFCKSQPPQDSLQDARKRLAVLLDARPAESLQRESVGSHLADRHAADPRGLQWAFAFSAAYHRRRRKP